jgi:hypothetical protein
MTKIFSRKITSDGNMQLHPHLDIVEQISRILSWPTAVGIIAWVVRNWYKGQSRFKEIDENTKTTVAAVARIEGNHLQHMQSELTTIAVSNEKAVEVLHEISTGIKILVDRGSRV